jgi:hypothetical protein
VQELRVRFAGSLNVTIVTVRELLADAIERSRVRKRPVKECVGARRDIREYRGRFRVPVLLE